MPTLNSHIYYIIGLYVNEPKNFYNYIISIKNIYNKQVLIRIKKDEFKPLKMYNLYEKAIKLSNVNTNINHTNISIYIYKEIHDFIANEIINRDGTFTYNKEKDKYSLEVVKLFEKCHNKDYSDETITIPDSDKYIIGNIILKNERKFVKIFLNYEMTYDKYDILGHDAKFRTKKYLKIIDINNKKFYLNYKIIINCSYLYKKNAVNNKFQNVIYIYQ
jgi:hypothetical protein